MMHAKKIREIVEAGRHEEAHGALDQLLSLGPNNIEALKLRATLYEYEGRFAEVAAIWDRIGTIDNEDPDAIHHILQRQLEDREHFYFTDDLPGGGRLFMAYPRQLVSSSALGLVGCMAFLASTRLTDIFPVLAKPQALLVLFGLFVIIPWTRIIHAYLRSIKSVGVSTRGIVVHTRLKQWSFQWNEIDRVCLAHHMDASGRGRLALVLLPKEAARRPVEVDLHQDTTAIRARSHLVREIARVFRDPDCVVRDSLELGQRRSARY